MSETGGALPPGWAWAALEDLGSWSSGGTPPRSEASYYGGDIPWLKIGDLTDGDVHEAEEHITGDGLRNSSAKLVEPGSLLVAMYGSIGKYGIARRQCTTNQAIAFCGPNAELTSSTFLAMAIRRYRADLIALGQGGTQPNISQGILKAFRIPLPPPAEQRRIVAKLDELLASSRAARAALDAVAALLERYREAVLSAAFRADLTPNDLANDGRDRQPSDDGLPRIPSTWRWATAADVVEPGCEIVYGIVQPGPHVLGGVPYVRGKDIQDGRILVHQLLRTSSAIADRYRRASLREGDVLLGIIRATKVAVVPAGLDGANITQGTARFRPSRAIRTHFLAGWLSSPFAQRWLHARYRGIDMPGLNLRDVRRLPVPLAPLREQDAIVALLDQAERRIETVRTRVAEGLAAVNALEGNVLARAFRGKLVPHDPSDEPATAVLARVGAGPEAERRRREPSRRR